MMNINDEDVNLGIGMGSTKFSILTRLLSTSGAGVNADSRVNLAFATSDPLSELVWSPRNGLSLKYANSGAADKKPVLLWNVGPSSTEGLSPLQSITLKQSGDGPIVDQGNLTNSQTVLGADDMIIDKATLLKASGSHCDSDGSENDRIMEEEADKKDPIREDSCMVDWEANSCHPQNVQTDAVAPAIPLKKLESSAENYLCRLTENEDFSLGGAEVPRPRENALPGGSRMKNGRGKALSDGDIYGRSSDNEDDSHESAESCNGAGLSLKGIKGIKRQMHDKGVILGSKRMKIQIHGSHGSTSVTRPDSSFMNWISNMTKGLSNCNKEDPFTTPTTLACSNDVNGKNFHENFMCFRQQDSAASISMGFQTIFQSLYWKEAGVLNAGGKASIEESRESVVPENLPGSYDRNCEHTILCNKEVNPIIVETNLAKKALEDLVSNREKDGVMPGAKEAYIYPDDPRTSLWITRLSTKTHRSEKGKEIAGETTGSYPKADLDACIKSEASFEVKSISKLCPILPCSEAMASVFARRLDALRHITSSKKGKFLTCLHICFFCGGCHDIRECPNVAKSEIKDLLLKLSTFEGVEESSCFCIRCSESDHWAVSCSSRQRISEQKAMDCSSRKPLLGYFPRYQSWKFEISSDVCDIASGQNTAAQSQIFDLIRKLQLTRADILRWMNSSVSLSRLNGFFLRLRLGKHDAGLGRSSYYVACIEGDARENDLCTSNKSILVDFGGIKSSVATQYVSNHGFPEDEIKAWWCRTEDSGCRIPSLAELNSKLNDRKALGL